MKRRLLGFIIFLVLASTYSYNYITKPIINEPIYSKSDASKFANIPNNTDFTLSKSQHTSFCDFPIVSIFFYAIAWCPTYNWEITAYSWTWYSESNGSRYTHFIGVRHNDPDWVNYRIVSSQSVSEDKMKEEVMKYVIGSHKSALEYNFYDFRQGDIRVRLYDVPSCVGETPSNGSCLFISGESTRFSERIKERGQEKTLIEETKLIDMVTLEVSDEIFLSTPRHVVKYLTYKYPEYGTPSEGHFSGPTLVVHSVNHATETYYTIHARRSVPEDGKMKWVVTVYMYKNSNFKRIYFISSGESGNNTIEEWKKYN